MCPLFGFYEGCGWYLPVAINTYEIAVDKVLTCSLKKGDK